MFGLIDCERVEEFSLLSVNVDCKIENLLAVLSSSFIYRNSSGLDTEALFSFPLEGSCAVFHFEAEIGGKSILGVCKELQEAKNMYQAAKEAGHKTAMIERNTSMQDVFTCRIGNFPKNTEAKISLKFVMELNLNLDGHKSTEFDRFSLCLPLILRPRYTPDDYRGDTEVFHVSNQYEYTFQATVTGTKEIKDIFSNNHRLKLIFGDTKKKSAKVTLESKFDGTHDLDVYIDYVTMKVPSVLLEYGSASNQYNGVKSGGAFFQKDVLMLNFLPEFESNIKVNRKIEIVFIVDRSGSMGGSNILHAKECLLIFLKSLPTNCKFQIYGFGSTFDKAFDEPQLYDERSFEVALAYQRQIEANFGGTELMLPLRTLYGSRLSDDYQRVAFLLTDGDVGNQDELSNLVRQHNRSTRLFTVGIGDGVSTSLVKKVAESGLGKAVFVRDSKTLSGSVIELLDIALNCGQFTNCKVEWQCPKHISIVTVPSTIGPIFSNYFLTVFALVSGMTVNDSVKCSLSGQVAGKTVIFTQDVSTRNGISDSEFRVHRLLAKYKIDEMTRELEDGREELRKPLVELSLESNMVTNFTTFVAIDPEVPNVGVIVDDEPTYDMDEIDYFGCGGGGGGFDVPDGLMFLRGDAFGSLGESEEECCFSAVRESCDDSKNMVGLPTLPISDEDFSSKLCFDGASPAFNVKGKSGSKQNEKDIIMHLVEEQSINGFWKYDEDIIRRFGLDPDKVRNEMPDSITNVVWMTVIVYLYLRENLQQREKEWRLFAKKAKDWVEKQVGNSAAAESVMKKALQILS